MPGGKQFATPGTKGSGEKVAVSERPEVLNIEADSANSIASGDSYTVDVFAPTGSIYQVFGLVAVGPTDNNETAGYHRWRIQDVTNYAQLDFESDYTEAVAYDRSHIRVANQKQLPSTEIAQQNQVHQMRATEDSAISLVYDNETDTSTGRSVVVRLAVQEDSY